jgi:pimeloyl-ACP methyl ester carboxylesterase
MSAWCWQEHFLAAFAQRGYHAAALDLRGHGESAGRDYLREATIDDYVADVAEVASRFPTPPVVLGHSMGGLITQRFASRHPVSGAVLLASSPINGMRRYGWTFVRAHPVPFLKAWLTRDIHRIYPDNRRVRYFMFSPQTPSARVLARVSRNE